MKSITVKQYRDFLSMGNFVSFRGYKGNLGLIDTTGEKAMQFVQWVLGQEKDTETMEVMSAVLRSRYIELRINGDFRSAYDPLIEDMKSGDLYYKVLGENGVFLIHDYTKSNCIGIRYVPYPGHAEKYI